MTAKRPHFDKMSESDLLEAIEDTRHKISIAPLDHNDHALADSIAREAQSVDATTSELIDVANRLYTVLSEVESDESRTKVDLIGDLENITVLLTEDDWSYDEQEEDSGVDDMSYGKLHRSMGELARDDDASEIGAAFAAYFNIVFKDCLSEDHRDDFAEAMIRFVKKWSKNS